MAMGAFDKEDFQAPMAEINTTPLVDVMLVLLVIFLVTAPMLTHAVKLELPNETTTVPENTKAVTISIDGAGRYYWDDTPVTEAQLDERLRVAALEDQNQNLHLRADRNAAYGQVGHVLAAAQRHGLTRIGFLTEPK